MKDIIHLLPENVANQIAAGEVVQRPASVVKELLENAIDAGAKRIELIVKDAGKTLIQVKDNGQGMSENDARMAFERHATSKISSAHDLFTLVTKGFRGEALASIAAVAQVKCITRPTDEEMAFVLQIEGNKTVEQSFEAAPIGTSIEVKNLFFNIPARRNFLKSDQVEYNHITDEFERVALAHVDVEFRFFHNGGEVFHLPAGNLRKRITQVFGAKYDEKLVPIKEDTPHVKVHGFVGKPQAAKKRRGEQFFFVNNRFIKSTYLHHAVNNAFDGLISSGHHPSYFLFLEIDPATVDVNIHPTKTEVKFSDEKMVYAVLRSSVKHALGKHNVSPSLDFEAGQAFSLPASQYKKEIKAPSIQVNPDYNPFSNPKPTSSPATAGNGSHFTQTKKSTEQYGNAPIPQNWESLMPSNEEIASTQKESAQAFLFASQYIIRFEKDVMQMIHPRRAHERVLYESFFKALQKQTIPSQQLLFPQNINLSPDEFQRLEPWISVLSEIGFDLENMGGGTLAFYGLPVNLEESSLENVIAQLLENIRELGEPGENKYRESIAKSLAKAGALRNTSKLKPEEIQNLMKELFRCDEPYVSISGKPVISEISREKMDKLF